MDVNDTERYVTTFSDKNIDKSIVSRVGLKKIVRVEIGDRIYFIYFYVGERHDYIIIPFSYCSCKNFLIKVMNKKTKLTCKHLLMLKYALENNLFRTIRINNDKLLKNIISEIISIG
ncbi:MAG: SWIM zinc finger family protein, partial [Staphylothermus sp.]|nr:SWIM zinc finger family protein [Staphylothermus sp.]